LVEIIFPIEFIVSGTPVSLQAKRSRSRDEWKKRVRAASSDAIPSPHFVSSENVAVTLFCFPAERIQRDIDNIVKPVLDALSKHFYADDEQVGRVVEQKFRPESSFFSRNHRSNLRKS
jgi:crossover junction endodeoxyribonuclease RusA